MEEFPRTIYGHDSAGEPQCPAVDSAGILDVSATRVSGWKTATITVASDDDLSNEVDLGEHFRYLAVIIPTIDEARVGVQVATASGGSFVTLGCGSAAKTDPTTGAYATVFDIGGWRYVKVSTSAAQSADRSISIQGVRG